MTDEINETPKVVLAKSSFTTIQTNKVSGGNPWTISDNDLMEVMDHDEYEEVVQACRFFYRRDPVASTVINKLVDIGITDLEFDETEMGDNEFRVFEGLKNDLVDFAEQCAYEYLISGLVVPEISFGAVRKSDLERMGVKRRSTLTLPTSLWVRDSSTIKIKQSILSDRPSYFLKIPDDLIFFITTKGQYSDGTKDVDLYEEILEKYPELVAAIRAGDKVIKLENNLIIRRGSVSDSPYPTPYLYPALEPLKHKRNLRRMDYSIASRVISAIQLIKMGNDEFPVTEAESEEDPFEYLRSQMRYRNLLDAEQERIFQLFANHTVEIEWIFPDTAPLVDGKKYDDINQDIIFALGFPRILITGESARTGTSDPEFATLSPIKTMESIRRKIIYIINDVVYDIIKNNSLNGKTTAKFKPINLHSFRYFVESMTKLYNSGNISRKSYSDVFGYDIEEELRRRSNEKELMEKLELDEFSPIPHSQMPNQVRSNPNEGGSNENNNEN